MEVLILCDDAGQHAASATWRRLHANGVRAHLTICRRGHAIPPLVQSEMSIERPTIVGLFCNEDIGARIQEIRRSDYAIWGQEHAQGNQPSALIDGPDAWSTPQSWKMVEAFLGQAIESEPLTLTALQNDQRLNAWSPVSGGDTAFPGGRA